MSNSVYLNPDLETIFLQRTGLLTSYPRPLTTSNQSKHQLATRSSSTTPQKKTHTHTCKHECSNPPNKQPGLAKRHSAGSLQRQNHPGISCRLGTKFDTALDKQNTLKLRLKKCSKAAFSREVKEFRRECWPTKPKKEVYSNAPYTAPITLEDKLQQMRSTNQYLRGFVGVGRHTVK